MAIFSLWACLVCGSTVSTTITFTAAPPAQANCLVVANPNVATADGSSAVTITVTARDAAGNFVPGSAVSLSASGTGNTFAAASGNTDANGIYTTTLRSTMAQAKTVTATFDGSATSTTSVSFVAGPASAATSTFVVNPNTAVADGNSTLSGVLTLLDAQGNSVAGVTPSFSVSGGNTTIASTGATTAAGQSSANYTSSLVQNENALVTAGGLSFAAVLSFTPGPVATSTSSLVASPNIVAGNGTATLNLVTTARDAQGNRVSGQSVALTASGGNTTFGAASGTTLSDGTYTTTLKSTKMQTETITAVIAGSVNESVSVTFTGSPNATTSTLTASPTTQTVGSGNFITATLTLRDAASNPLAGVTPSWTATGTKNTIVSAGVTSSAGVGTATYSSTLAQNENISVSNSGVSSLYQPVTFVAGSPNATISYLYSTPVRQLANNANSIVTSLMLLDAYSNGVSGQTATFSASGNNTTVSGATTTNSTGLAQATYKTGTIQNQNALVTAGGFTLATPIIFTDVPAQCVLSVNPNVQTADGNSAMALTATVTNSSSQPVPNVQVVFSSTGAAQTFAAQNVTTTASGQAASSLKSSYAGSNTLLAQAANVQCASQGNFLTRTPYCTGNPNYSSANYGTGSNPRAITTGDFNGDGKQDLAIINQTGNTLGIFLNTGTGTFRTQVTYATGSNPLNLTIGDFNGDGKQDVAVTNNGNKTLGIFLGTGTGTFQAQVTYATDDGPNGVTTGDFNGDGKQDVVVANSNTLGIFLGTGTGTFQTQVTYATGSNPLDLTIGDFNGDGKQDVAVTNNGNKTLGIFLGTGTGTFQTQGTYATDDSPQGLTIGDFDGDGKQDVAVANAGSGTLGIFLGTGTGTFQTQVTYATGYEPFKVTTHDFNGDGKQDLVVTNSISNTLGIFQGTGTGTFQTQTTYATGSYPAGVTTGDFNGDGKQDVAIVHETNGNLQIFINTCH